MKYEFELLPPTMPSLISLKGTSNASIKVKDLTPEQALEYAEFIKKEFIRHYEQLKDTKHKSWI